MIYRHPSNKIQTPEQQATLAESLYLRDETLILRKSLLVIYYYYKERKVIPQSFISKMSLIKECKSIEVKKKRAKLNFLNNLWDEKD